MFNTLFHRVLAVALSCLCVLPSLTAMAQGEGGEVVEAKPQSNFFTAFVVPGLNGGDDGGPAKGAMLGIVIIFTLLLMSVFVTGFSIMMLMKNRRQDLCPEDLQDELEELIASKNYREAVDVVEVEESYLGKICYAALKEASHGYASMERSLEESSDMEAARILRPLEILNVLGNISPMLGLFGTVYGMIIAFMVLVDSGGSGDPTELAGGISTALVTTFWGLVVAIPAMTMYALVRNRVDAMCSEAMVTANEIISPFKPRKKKSGSSSSGRPSSSPRP